MYKLEFEKIGQNISLNEIKEFEEEVKIDLPQEVKEFYLLHNGGVPKQYIYRREDDIYVINHFMPIKNEIYEDLTIEQVYVEMIEDEIFPEKYLPFALEESGGYFLISLIREEYGYVYYWNSEYDDIDSFLDNIKLLADNFVEFCSYLTDRHLD